MTGNQRRGNQSRGQSGDREGRQQTRQSSNAAEETAALFDKKPPFDVNAERSLLGSIILLPTTIDDVVSIVDAIDFYDDANQKIYEAISHVYQSTRRFDIVLVIDRLRALDQLEAVGGTAVLSKLINFVPNAAHATYYAEIVRAKSLARRVIVEMSQLLADAYDDRVAVSDLVSAAEAAVARVSDATIIGRDSQAISEIVIAAMELLDQRMAGTAPRILDTGLDALRDCMGLIPGGLTLIGGRTSMGKSALCITIAKYVSRVVGRVYLATLEMTATEVADRILSAEARVDSRNMMTGRLRREEREEIVERAGEASHWQLYIDDRPSMTVPQIAAAARRITRRFGPLSLLIVDYLQIIDVENKRESRVEQLATISRSLKRLARELRVPVVAAVQVNRGSEDNSDRRPRLSQLRGSGDLEQDADAVVFVHRPAYYQAKDANAPQQVYGQPENAEIIVAKNRNGPTGIIEVLWFREYMLWANKAHARFEDDVAQGANF